MKNRVVKVIGLSFTVALIIGASVFLVKKLLENKDSSNSKIISSGFIGYDLARAVIGDNSGVSMILAPGVELHNFEPTPEDIIKIKNADLFIYVGGESESWVEGLLENSEIPKEKTLRLMDFVQLREEEVAEGMKEDKEEEEGVEYDEHIWTSPANTIKLLTRVEEKLVELYPENKKEFKENAEKYNNQLLEIDKETRGIVKNGNKNELIFGDRFPFLYFTEEYSLKYYAAFSGCSDQTEASSKTIAFLIEKAKKDNIKVILKIELTSDKLSKTIAEEVGAKVLELNAAHNISVEDFNRGITYAEIMKNNLKVLEEALR